MGGKPFKTRQVPKCILASHLIASLAGSKKWEVTFLQNVEAMMLCLVSHVAIEQSEVILAPDPL